MTCEEAQHLALTLMTHHGLAGWEFRFNRAKRRAGCCWYEYKRIELSRYFCETNTVDLVHDTILHEIAHALAGPVGHSPLWRQICLAIGARPERCYPPSVTMPRGAWRALCANCGREHERHRRPKPGLVYACKPCGRQAGTLSWHKE